MGTECIYDYSGTSSNDNCSNNNRMGNFQTNVREKCQMPDTYNWTDALAKPNNVPLQVKVNVHASNKLDHF